MPAEIQLDAIVSRSRLSPTRSHRPEQLACCRAHDLIAVPALAQLLVANCRRMRLHTCATLSELVGFTSASRPAA